MNVSYTIKDIIDLLLGKLWLLILTMVVGGVGAFCYAQFMMPMKYDAYTSLYVRSNSVISNLNVDLGELNASRSLLNTYVVVLKSNYVMDKVANALEMEYQLEDLEPVFQMKNNKIVLDSIRSKITMSSIDGTEVMKISANTTNPEISAAICNHIAESAMDSLTRIVGAGSVEIIDTAEPIYVPVSPNKPRTTLLGALVGLCLAAFVILLIDFFDNSIKSAETITQKFGKSVFGEIMNFGGESHSKNLPAPETSQTILDPAMDFNVTESYKSIRSNIMFTFSTMERKILAISSANPSEGKSTTAVNIALAFAQTESKVLLIDADMRKPVQHKHFKLANKSGLSTAIGHMNPIQESIQKKVYKNLDVMTSGPIPPNPSEMLASQQFSDLLDELEPQYDYILIDTPPINVVSDTMVISKLISGILLVVRHAQTTFEEAQEALNRAELSEANVVGFVLNNISRKSSGHYYSYKYKYKYGYKSYGYGYGYGSYGHEPKLDEIRITKREDPKT